MVEILRANFLPQRPGGTRIAVLGSSSTQFGNTTSGVQLFSNSVGVLQTLQARFPMFDYTVWRDPEDARGFSGLNFGYSGQTNGGAGGLLSKLPDVIAAAPRLCILQMSQNDANNGANVSTMLSQVREAAETLLAATILPILMTLNPRGQTGASPIALTDVAYFRRQNEYNSGLAELSKRLGVPFVDTRPYLYDFSASALGVAKTGVSLDGLHMTPYGAWLASLAAEAVLRDIISPDTPFDLIAGSSNIFTNGLLSGTGGGHATTTQQNGTVGQSGSLPDKVRMGLIANSSSNSSAVNSIVDDPIEGKAIRTVFTLSSANATSRWRYTFTDQAGAGGYPFAPASSPVGKWLRAALPIYIESGGEYLQFLQLTLQSRDGSSNSSTTLEGAQVYRSTASTDEPVADASLKAQTLWLITDAFLVPSGGTHLYFDLEIQLAGTGETVTWLSRPNVFEVADPRF